MNDSAAFDLICRISAGLAIIYNLRWPGRITAVLAVLATQLLFKYALSDTPDQPLYHAAAALCDLGAMTALHLLPTTRFTRDLQLINFASLIANALGYFLWLCYIPPIYYNQAMLAIMTIQAIRFLWVTHDDQRCDVGGAWRGLFRPVDRNCASPDY